MKFRRNHRHSGPPWGPGPGDIFDDVAGEERASERSPTPPGHLYCLGSFFSRTAPQHIEPVRRGSGAGRTSRNSGGGTSRRATAANGHDRKSVGDRPGRDEQGGASNLRGHYSQKRPNGLVQEQLGDAGQPDVRHAGPDAGLIREMRGYICK